MFSGKSKSNIPTKNSTPKNNSGDDCLDVVLLVEMITYYCVQVITLCINGTVQSKVSIFQILVVFVLVWSNGYLASIQHVSSISCPHLMFQRIANYKSFTRFHINRDGNLEVFTLAVDKVPREWMLDPDWDMEQKQPQQLSHREIP